MIILGIHVSFNGNSHDSSASIIVKKSVVAACEEERFNRQKSSQLFFPHKSIKFCLNRAKVNIEDVDLISVDGKTFKNMKAKVEKSMKYYFGFCPKIEMVEHSLSHSYGSFFSSGFKSSLVVSIDGIGDNISTLISIFSVKNNRVFKKEIYREGRDKSIGDFYGIFTNYLGFRLNEGEFKMMGMSALGKPSFNMDNLIKFDTRKGKIISDLNKIKSLKFNTNTNEPIYNSKNIKKLFNVQRRLPSAPFKKIHYDLASSVQSQFNKVYVNMINYFGKKYNQENLCLSGGCALNCLSNSKFLEGNFKNIYVMPAASDRGLSLGNAMFSLVKKGIIPKPPLNMFLGPSYNDKTVLKIFKNLKIKYKKIKNLSDDCSNEIKKGKIIGWFQGRSEFGPRALGARSILANPKIKNMKNKLNLKIKNREDYRPFAPSILDEDFKYKDKKNSLFEYMTFSLFLEKNIYKNFREAVHFDDTSRVHIVLKKNNPIFYNLLKSVKKKIGYGCVINTSFNLNNEPIVNSPLDAIKTFFGSGIDILYINNFKITK